MSASPCCSRWPNRACPQTKSRRSKTASPERTLIALMFCGREPPSSLRPPGFGTRGRNREERRAPTFSGLLRRCAPRNDDSIRTQRALRLSQVAPRAEYSCIKGGNEHEKKDQNRSC